VTELLAPPFESFSPEGFRAHVRGLYAKREKKVRSGKPKAPVVSWSLTKKGAVTVKVRRKPKWIAPDERIRVEREIFAEHKIGANLVFLAMKRLKIKIVTEQEATDIVKRTVGVTP
jgi:hypothetical protein